MIADVLSMVTSALSIAATYFLHSTLFIGGVWLLLRFRPAISQVARELLWKSALVAGVASTCAQSLLLPANPLRDLSFVLPLAPPAAEHAGIAKAAPNFDRTMADRASIEGAYDEWLSDWSNDSIEAEPQPLRAVKTVDFHRAPPVSAAGADLSGTTVASRSQSKPATGTSSLLVTIVALATASIAYGSCRYVAQYFALRRKLAGTSEMTEGVARRLLDDLIRFVPRGRAVTLLAGPECAEPIAFGLFRWTIVLPVRAECELSEDELRSLLAHELAHLVRGDAWWLLCCRVVCAVCGFQPLNDLARREWQRAAEFLCDGWAVSRTGNRLALARCLTEVAGWRWQSPDCAATLAATGRRNGLADRIESLIQEEPAVDIHGDRRLRFHLTWTMALALAGIVCLGPRIRLFAALPDSNNTTGIITEADLSEIDSSTEKSSLPIEGSETARLIQSLDAELKGLESELAALRPLLAKTESAPAARRLADRLEKSLEQFRQRREMLSQARVIPPAAGQSERVHRE